MARIREEEVLTKLGVEQKRIIAQDVVIWDLWSDLLEVQEVPTCLSEQLGWAPYIQDDAWSHGYLEDLERMRDYVILNPQEDSEALEGHLWDVDLKDLQPDSTALNHKGEIG